MDKEQALDHLEKTVVAAATWEQDTGQRYAAIVTATATCLDAKATRKEIAERLKKSSAGSVSRFILLARHAKKAVKALNAGNTLRQVYFTIRDANRPEKGPKTYADPVQAAANRITTMTIRTGASTSVKLVDNLATWAGALMALVMCPLAEKVMPERERKRVNTVIKNAVEQAGDKAAA